MSGEIRRFQALYGYSDRDRSRSVLQPEVFKGFYLVLFRSVSPIRLNRHHPASGSFISVDRGHEQP